MKAVRLVLAASLVSTLAACGSSSFALSDAIGKGFDPKAKGVKYITVFESVPENGTMQLSANNKVQTLKKGDNLDTAFLKRDKISYYDYVGKINVNGQVIDLERGDFMVYKQDNSAVAAKYIKQKADPADGNKLKDLQAYEFKVGEVQGKEIAFKDLPQLGRYTYRGIAFNGDDNSGRLTYTIDFEKKQGQGKISGMAPDYNVDLAAANIAAAGAGSAINGRATLNNEDKGSYRLNIFGSKAEEIAGKAQVKVGDKEKDIGLAGKKE